MRRAPATQPQWRYKEDYRQKDEQPSYPIVPLVPSTLPFGWRRAETEVHASGFGSPIDDSSRGRSRSLDGYQGSHGDSNRRGKLPKDSVAVSVTAASASIASAAAAAAVATAPAAGTFFSRPCFV